MLLEKCISIPVPSAPYVAVAFKIPTLKIISTCVVVLICVHLMWMSCRRNQCCFLFSVTFTVNSYLLFGSTKDSVFASNSVCQYINVILNNLKKSYLVYQKLLDL